MTNFKPNNWPTTTLVTWIRKITPPCKEVTRLLSQSMDRRLPIHKRLGIWLHFMVCNFCKRYAKHLAFIRQASRSMVEHAEQISSASLSDSAKKRVKHELGSAQR